jgi:hypothetical protein
MQWIRNLLTNVISAVFLMQGVKWCAAIATDGYVKVVPLMINIM